MATDQEAPETKTERNEMELVSRFAYCDRETLGVQLTFHFGNISTILTKAFGHWQGTARAFLIYTANISRPVIIVDTGK